MASRGLAPKIRARLVGLALLGAIACGGSAFSTEGAGGGNSTGGQPTAGSANAVAGSLPTGGSVVSPEGGSAAGEQGAGAQTAGEPSVAGAGAGSGGAPAALSCSELEGVTFAKHCYVDVTAEPVNQLAAVAACADLASRAGRAANLLVLDTEDEQSFIIQTFLSEVTDAWLALTCGSIEHPVLTDCYCVDCEDGVLLQKRATWSWSDGSSASFGWSGRNPDNNVRCSALAYNPSISTWGWVDRSCISTFYQNDDLPRHSYRVICELP